MLTCLVLLLLVPLFIVLVVAILFGFGALLLTLLRFVLPVIIIAGILWLICSRGTRRHQHYEREAQRHHHRQAREQMRSSSRQTRKDITDQTTHKDDDNWNDF